VERFRAQIARVKDVEGVPIILVGNKADRANEREVSREEAQAMARKLGCDLSPSTPLKCGLTVAVETSAKTRSNLELAY